MNPNELKRYIDTLEKPSKTSILTKCEMRILNRLYLQLIQTDPQHRASVFSEFFSFYFRQPNSIIIGLGIKEMKAKAEDILRNGFSPIKRIPAIFNK